MVSTQEQSIRVPGEVGFGGRLALQQRVLPAYRAPFFDLLAKSCHGGLSVFAGEPREGEMIRSAAHLKEARWVHAENVHLLAGSWYLLRQKQIITWLKTFDPDALILEANPRYLSNRDAMTWMHNKDRPVIGWALGAPQVRGLFAGVRGWLRKRYLLRFDALIAYSRKGADEYKAIGFPEDRIFIAYNAVSPAPMARPNRQSFRGREPHILFVGRLQDRKRIDMLLDVCARLSRQPELVIVGDGPAREYFEALAADIYPKARFIGSAYGDELNRWFEWADLFVLPGTGGLAVQQAMAEGLPVIVAQGDGTQNDLVSAQNGWLVPPGDNDRLLQVLNTALQDPELLIEMGRKSFEMSMQRFNIEMMVKVFLEAIESVLRA